MEKMLKHRREGGKDCQYKLEKDMRKKSVKESFECDERKERKKRVGRDTEETMLEQNIKEGKDWPWEAGRRWRRRRRTGENMLGESFEYRPRGRRGEKGLDMR